MKYRYIEISDTNHIKIHLEYVHPSYDEQGIFINDNMSTMITVLDNSRCFFYRAIDIKNEDPKVSRKIKWELIR